MPDLTASRHRLITSGIAGCISAYALLLTPLVTAPAAASAGGTQRISAQSISTQSIPAQSRPATEWTWPIEPRHEVVNRFAPPPRPWLSGHRGVDLAARPGVAVVSAGAGVVTYAGLLAGRGVVVVQHGALRTTYEPVHASVTVGRRVAAGELLGTLGLESGHCLPFACLHWGLRNGDTYLDPLRLVAPTLPRLLPLDGREIAVPGFSPITGIGSDHRAATASGADRVDEADGIKQADGADGADSSRSDDSAVALQADGKADGKAGGKAGGKVPVALVAGGVSVAFAGGTLVARSLRRVRAHI